MGNKKKKKLGKKSKQIPDIPPLKRGGFLL